MFATGRCRVTGSSLFQCSSAAYAKGELAAFYANPLSAEHVSKPIAIYVHVVFWRSQAASLLPDLIRSCSLPNHGQVEEDSAHQGQTRAAVQTRDKKSNWSFSLGLTLDLCCFLQSSHTPDRFGAQRNQGPHRE